MLDENCFWLESGPPKWLAGEPGARQTLSDGADLVTFSTDKLLGGPQAGIIAGKTDLIEKCLNHPFARAVRPGALILSSLQELGHRYLNREWERIPFWKMAIAPIDALRERAENLGVGTPVPLKSIPGGGTLPQVEIQIIWYPHRWRYLNATQNGNGQRFTNYCSGGRWQYPSRYENYKPCF